MKLFPGNVTFQYLFSWKLRVGTKQQNTEENDKQQSTKHYLKTKD